MDKETTTLKTTREDYLAKVEAARLKGATGTKLQIEIYELDFIWSRIGNYATDLGLEIKLDLFAGTEEKALNDFKLYNLKISVVGAYTDIVRFIFKIEGDREISAQVSDFSMQPTSVASSTSDDNTADDNTGSTTSNIINLVAEFTLKNVPLNYKNIMEDSAKKPSGTNINDLKLPEEIDKNLETKIPEQKNEEDSIIEDISSTQIR